jgi:hypothetical protein
MAIELQPSSEQVELADKKGGTPYMLVVAVILLGIMTTMYFTSNKLNRGDNLAQIQSMAGEIKDLKSENKQLRAELLSTIKQSQNEKEELIKNTDSVIREAAKKRIK